MYNIQPLYGPGSIVPGEAATYPFGINAAGDVTGVNYAVLWDSSNPPQPAYTEMGAIWKNTKLVFTQPWNSENNSCLYSINGSDDAVGVRATDNSPTQLADYVRGVIVYDMGPSVGAGSVATHINAAGLASGWSWAKPESFVYDTHSNSVVSWISPLPGNSKSYAAAINSAGQVVGISDGNGFFFSAGSLKDLGPAAFVTKINDAGIACGSVGKATPQDFAAAICDTSQAAPTFVEIPPPPGFAGSHADGINLRGDVVGSCWMAGSIDVAQSAFIYSNGVSYDLNSQILVAGWHLEYATDINDAGQIIGYGTYNGQQVGFLLTPKRFFPPPPTGRHWHITVPELVGTLLGGVAVDGGGWIFIGGYRVPVDPWGPWLSMEPAKRDALVALALDEAAMYIVDEAARETVRKTLIDVAKGRIENLAKVANQGRSASAGQQAGQQIAVGAGTALRLKVLRDGKTIQALRRFGRTS